MSSNTATSSSGGAGSADSAVRRNSKRPKCKFSFNLSLRNQYFTAGFDAFMICCVGVIGKLSLVIIYMELLWSSEQDFDNVEVCLLCK